MTAKRKGEQRRITSKKTTTALSSIGERHDERGYIVRKQLGNEKEAMSNGSEPEKMRYNTMFFILPAGCLVAVIADSRYRCITSSSGSIFVRKMICKRRRI